MKRSIPFVRTLLFVALVSLVAATAEGAKSAAPPKGPAHRGATMTHALGIGTEMPASDVSMQNVDGTSLTLAKASGKKGTLVLFICNHCPWVKAWQSRIAEVGNAAAKQGIGVIAINSNDPEAYAEDSFDEMVKRAKEVGYAFPYVVDATSDVARQFGASHTPEAFLFDAKGKLVYHGAVDDNAQDLKAVQSRWLADAVSAVATGKPVATAETKAMGCGIKLRGNTAL